MVRGLTTYIMRRMQEFMVVTELPQNSHIVVDGNSVAINIYLQLTGRNSCFGGDYDRYMNAVTSFFKMLLDCKVVPYVLLDGCTDPVKAEMSLERLKKKVEKTLAINCCNETEYVVFPPFLYNVFIYVLQKMNISMVICDSDCDKEVANLSQAIDCPVLSCDSDFFIFDVKYIPFFLNVNEPNLYQFKKVAADEETEELVYIKVLRCMLFDRQKFLKTVGLTQNMLPVLSILLGNDYIERVENIPQLCRSLKFPRFKTFMDSAFRWLGNKDVNDTIEQIEKFFSRVMHQNKKQLIQETIDFYHHEESKYLKYFQSESSKRENIPLGCLGIISENFVQKYRHGLYHHQFLDILLFNKYFPSPLIENINKKNVHEINFPISSAIHKILTNNSEQDLFVYGRIGTEVHKIIVPKYIKELPNYDDLFAMDDQKKLIYFSEILNIQQEYINNCLKLFPKSWHIMMLTLKYISIKSKLLKPLLYSILICKIMISHVDRKIGRIRSFKDLKRCDDTSKNTHIPEFIDITQALEEIHIDDCVTISKKFIPFFKISTEMQHDENLFDRNLVHFMSEYQSCLLHVDSLNDLFGLTFDKCFIWECYNGTFIYNLFSNLQENNNFINNLLEESPTILQIFNFILSSSDSFCN